MEPSLQISQWRPSNILPQGNLLDSSVEFKHQIPVAFAAYRLNRSSHALRKRRCWRFRSVGYSCLEHIANIPNRTDLVERVSFQQHNVGFLSGSQQTQSAAPPHQLSAG